MSNFANEVKNIVNEVEGIKEENTMTDVVETKVEEVKGTETKVTDFEPYDPKDKTDFQIMLEILNEAGYINPRDRKNLYIPIHYPDSFKEEFIETVVQDNRSLNAMKRAQINTVGQLIDRWDELSRLKNIGKKSIKLLKNGLIQKYYDTLNVEKKAQFLMEIIKMNSKSESVILNELGATE